MSLTVHTSNLPPEGVHLAGEEPVGFLGLEKDKFAHDAEVLRYDLQVMVVSEEIVVQGRLQTGVSVMCSRCGGFFSTTLEVSSFLRAYKLAENQESVDLAPGIREELLLQIPTYPNCGWQGSGTCPHSGIKLDALQPDDHPAVDDRWDSLDELGSS